MGTNQNSRTDKLSQASDNTINNSFRLVAIRPYSGSSTDALKALHRDTTYFLVGDYKDKYENGKWVGIEKSSGVPLPHDFFSVKVLDENKKSLEMPFVNISAIVGKNGCGKSSLIEFLIRLITNVAIKQKSSPYKYYDRAEETYGKVFYETDKHLHNIDCFPCEQKDDGMDVDYSDKSNNGEMNKGNFFYSIISNYSLYAYNCKDNDKIWMDKLIRKNDGYQMPIVITPMRNEGNIDINKENDLSKLRLLSIFSQAENSLGRKINGNKYAEGVNMTLNSSSKLINYIKKVFSDERSDYYAISERIESFIKYMDDIETEEKPSISFPLNVFNHEIQFWTRFDKKFWTKYIDLINHANLIAKDLLPENKDYAQMYEYFNFMPPILRHNNIDSDNNFEESFDFLKEHCKFMNAYQFQSLMMIIYICDVWEEKKIFDAGALAQSFSELDEHHESTNTKVQAYLYVIYKTNSIFGTYEPYNEYINFDSMDFILFDGINEGDACFTDNLDECFKILFANNGKIDTNYQSLKLRQTLNFLTVEGLAEEYNFDYSKKNNNDDNPNYFSFKKLHKIIKENKSIDDKEMMSLLPPPIFSTEILVKENSDTFMLSSMSSGELQMLYSVGALIYHLRNLDYKVSNDRFIEYKYINIVLEEVEQYFHPEYQQDYVHTLLTYIANACFKNIKGINIVLVTHSPFVLSDIPKQNVLFLKEGLPTYSMQENTFGANIHSMLQNGFFLNGLPIGEFAKEKINELTKSLHNGAHDVENKDNDKNILNIINLIGEPIIKSQLLKMYSDYELPYIYENKIKELEAKIAKLEKKYDKD